MIGLIGGASYRAQSREHNGDLLTLLPVHPRSNEYHHLDKSTGADITLCQYIFEAVAMPLVCVCGGGVFRCVCVSVYLCFFCECVCACVWRP